MKLKDLKFSNRLLISGRYNLGNIFSVLGQITGLALFSVLILLLFSYNDATKAKDSAIGENFLIINKKISLLNTLKIGENATFKKQEITEIQSCTGVESVGKFQRNTFQATGSILFNDMPINGFRTDLFMESVPNDFIEFKESDWNWKVGEEIPIVLPAEFLNLYNLNYAPSRGLPQISQSMLQLIRLQIQISGNNEEAVFNGKIIGFTHRIQSILVPEKFLLWANSKFGKTTTTSDFESPRIIVKTNSKNPKDLLAYIDNNQLETNQELLKSTKFYYVVFTVLSALFFIGFIILFNSISSTITHFKLQIERLSYEIQTLKLLGFPQQKLIQIFTSPLLKLNGVVLLISYLFVYFASSWIFQLFEVLQVEIKSPLFIFGLISTTMIQLIIVGISFSTISREIKKENS